MKKIISIVLISLILLQTSDISFGDILQVKNLYQHAKYHQETYGDSFLAFFSEHYGDETLAHQDEHQEHGDLPFKHQHNCIDMTITVMPTTNYSIKEQPFLEIPFNFFYTESTSIFEKTAVFQPPKLV
jgi:hypothetical protein